MYDYDSWVFSIYLRIKNINQINYRHILRSKLLGGVGAIAKKSEIMDNRGWWLL